MLVVFAPCPAEGSPEKLIVKIMLNGEVKGDYLVHLDTDNDFLIRPDDLNAMGVKVPPGKTVVIDGQPYDSLRSLRGITYMFDKKTLTLNITLAPSLLSTTVIDLSPPGNLTVYYPREASAFLNYGLTYFHSDITGSSSFHLASKLGVRSGDFLFLTDSICTKTPDDSRFVRLMSNMTYERRGELQWFVAGDIFAASGDLGSTINIGGLSLTKVYRVNPYFIKQPMFSVSGVTSLPSEASVYLDGMLIKKEKLSPGAFDLNNLNYYGGAHLVEIVVKDAFGNEQRVVHPFYFTDALLRKRLHEYSYHIGFLRQQFGVESNDYGAAAFSAFHRYGVSDSLTLGGRAEATRGVVNIGPQLSFLIPTAGVVFLSLAASRNESNETGYASSFNHTYQYRSVATRLLYKKYSENYVTVQSTLLPARPKSEIGAGISYSFGRSGALSLDYVSARTYDGSGRDMVSATYSATIVGNLTGFVTARRIEDRITGTAYEYFMGINFTFGKDTYMSSLNRFSDGTRDNSVQVYKNIPSGEGLSYRASYESQDSDALRSDIVSPYVQYNARYGVYSADYSLERANGQDYNTYSLSAAGAMVYAGGTFGLTRPVNDSFSIVNIDELKDVKVSVANTEMGRTNSSGTLIIPEIKSYNYNQVSLDPSTIPMDYQLSDVSVYISPSQWSGSCIVVSAKKIQAFTGRILAGKDGGVEPVEIGELTMKVGSREMKFQTAKNGEFYFENTIPSEGKSQKVAFRGCQALSEKGAAPEAVISPGTYTASFEYQGKKCTVTLHIMKSDDVIVDLEDAISQCGEASESAPRVKEEAQPAKPANSVVTQLESEDNPPHSFVAKLLVDQNGTHVTPKIRKTISTIAHIVMRNPDTYVEIEGHADRHSSDKASVRLGMRMADAVKKYLLRSGVTSGRIKKVASLGRAKMICTGETIVCDKMNRRVIIRLAPGGKLKSGVEMHTTQASLPEGAR